MDLAERVFTVLFYGTVAVFLYINMFWTVLDRSGVFG